jgi:mannose-1-phosphate guanylyltransferase
MAGGRGERFWPLSVHNMPKPFLKILGSKTMIQHTVDRVSHLLPKERIFVVLGKPHLETAQAQLPHLPAANFLVEPEGRDTAPCIGYAASSLLEIDRESLMMVLPADHFIPEIELFLKTVSYGLMIARTGDYLVTIGIRPSRPETGYGYINAREPVSSSETGTCYKVERFVEKPDLARASQYLEEGDYFWNAGMFIWKAETVMSGISKHMPELYRGLLDIKGTLSSHDEDGFRQLYSNLVRKSIDYGLMEKADNVLMIRGDFTWDDVGTWSSLLRVMEPDGDGNYRSGDTICIDTKASVIFGDGLTVGTIGVENLVVVASRGGVLVADSGRAQDVREIARLVEARKKPED